MIDYTAGLANRRRRGESEPPALRVLVADDDHDARSLYAEYLRSLGMHVLTATNGLEAVELAERWVPDAIVLDIALPGLQGDEAICLIKANPSVRQTPIVAVSAYGSAIENRARAAGCDAFLAKPCLPDELAACLRELLLAAPASCQSA